MRKKILIGSLLVFALLLLMPSIPAIQQRMVEEGVKQEIQEKLETITLDDLKDITVLDNMKHPILYYIVILIWYVKILRYDINEFISEKTYEIGPFGRIMILNPILYYICVIRFNILFSQTILWIARWSFISETLGWNWDI